ncbi:thioredoxin reductase (NADPH) [Alkalibaculum bacchi]|uniref:Thioredoxin reductase (NADPH) n=1 Tax=Alkalibaculum bacchi TaxID=645887 RepID=A0A366I7S2_9FIRM|nr:NAD(P)/FAD-dependent oxidoreductase [Alkalibaculum bacchi]RBP63879.1 thioredoxin reductase (NADPH) [Alkalibaculum bacchi]
MVYDVIIIGKGPAGLSASLYTARGNLKTLILGKEGDLSKAATIENYCFIPKLSGKEMIDIGIEQARSFGADIVDAEVVGLKNIDDIFEVSTDQNVYQGKSIILATGKSKIKVPVEKLDEYEGKGVHYCATCDGYFYNGAKVGVLGYKDYAVHELKEFEPLTSNRVLYTNGNGLQISEESAKYLEEKNIIINNKKIQSVEGIQFLEKVRFQDGTEEAVEGLFVAYGSASSTDFARNLGVLIENGDIIVNRKQETDIEGVYAAGNCTGGLAQVATAVGEGATAGQEVKSYLRKKKP